jgi:hypothetical protein
LALIYKERMQAIGLQIGHEESAVGESQAAAYFDWFFQALKVDPDYSLAHYGVSRRLARKKDEILRTFFLKLGS